jgi:hypothetical protein
MEPKQDASLMSEAEVNQGCRCEVWSVTSVPLTLPLLPLIRHPHRVPSLETTIADIQDRCANLLLPAPRSSPTLPGTGEINIDVRPLPPPASCTTLPNTLTRADELGPPFPSCCSLLLPLCHLITRSSVTLKLSSDRFLPLAMKAFLWTPCLHATDTDSGFAHQELNSHQLENRFGLRIPCTGQKIPSAVMGNNIIDPRLFDVDGQGGAYRPAHRRQ